MDTSQIAIQLHWIAEALYAVAKGLYAINGSIVIAALIRAFCNK